MRPEHSPVIQGHKEKGPCCVSREAFLCKVGDDLTLHVIGSKLFIEDIYIDHTLGDSSSKATLKRMGGDNAMTNIELTEKEASTLFEILESYLSDLKTERVATENRELRTELKEREMIADELLKRLGAGKP